MLLASRRCGDRPRQQHSHSRLSKWRHAQIGCQLRTSLSLWFHIFFVNFIICVYHVVTAGTQGDLFDSGDYPAPGNSSTFVVCYL